MQSEEKLLVCPNLKIKRRKKQDLEQMLDAWKKEALWERRTFSSKLKKQQRQRGHRK